MKYEESTPFTYKEVEMLERGKDFSKVYRITDDMFLYPNLREDYLIFGFTARIAYSTCVIKEKDGVKYICRVEKRGEFQLRSKDYYKDTYGNNYTELSLLELDSFKERMKKMCLDEAINFIKFGVVMPDLVTMDGQPVFERLDKYVSID